LDARPSLFCMPGMGSHSAAWRRDGKELFFWSAGNLLMSVPITLKTGVVEVGAAQQLFHFSSPLGIVGVVSPYDVTADGQRLILITSPQQAPKSITLVTNWAAELKQRDVGPARN
jgi:hypothetical protein